MHHVSSVHPLSTIDHRITFLNSFRKRRDAPYAGSRNVPDPRTPAWASNSDLAFDAKHHNTTRSHHAPAGRAPPPCLPRLSGVRSTLYRRLAMSTGGIVLGQFVSTAKDRRQADVLDVAGP